MSRRRKRPGARRGPRATPRQDRGDVDMDLDIDGDVTVSVAAPCAHCGGEVMGLPGHSEGGSVVLDVPGYDGGPIAVTDPGFRELPDGTTGFVPHCGSCRRPWSFVLAELDGLEVVAVERTATGLHVLVEHAGPV